MTGSASGRLEGRHAVVTGGGKGIGAAIAAALAGAGARLTLMGRTAATLEAHAASLAREHGADVATVVVDVTDPRGVGQGFAEAASQSGPVEVLVNNAGQAHASPFEALTLDTWEQLLRVNLTGAFLCIQQVLPPMVAAGAGRIVNVASTAGVTGQSRLAAYCASKHGVIGLTRALAAETARHGVTVNAVCPGYTDDTDMVQMAIDNIGRLKGHTPEEARALLAKRSPRGTLVAPAEVADTVLWLCSPGASAITGQAIVVAAGEVMS